MTKTATGRLARATDGPPKINDDVSIHSHGDSDNSNVLTHCTLRSYAAVLHGRAVPSCSISDLMSLLVYLHRSPFFKLIIV